MRGEQEKSREISFPTILEGDSSVDSGLDYRGVIWISGYSAAGKTTVGRILESKLKRQGRQTVFLDGDHLRSIFAGKWGYQREERVELAHIYLRLCSHLASQGMIVILSAVALYKEVSEWFHLHIPRGLQVYLNVPEEERRRRDAETKQLYTDETDFSLIYDEPKFIAKYFDNFNVEPEVVADRILDCFFEESEVQADFGRSEHWNKFYSQQGATPEASPFARYVLSELEPDQNILEVGCGNARDSVFFAQAGHRLTGLDMCEAAIKFCQENVAHPGIEFVQGALPQVPGLHQGRFDCLYSRFVIHAMPLTEEKALWVAAGKALKPGGLLFVECRSINDPMARQGEVISPTERIHGHYRRFIVPREFRRRLIQAGFEILSEVESRGLAVHKDDDPMVVRVTARKPA